MYNYRKALRKDIKEWIEKNFNFFSIYNKNDFIIELKDLMCDDNNVTGWGSGDYQHQGLYSAEECISHNLDLYREAVENFLGKNTIELDDLDPKIMDCTIRCYLFDEILEEVVDEIYSN